MTRKQHEQLSFLVDFFEGAAEQTPGVYDEPFQDEPEDIDEYEEEQPKIDPEEQERKAQEAFEKDRASLMTVFNGNETLANYWAEKHRVNPSDYRCSR